MEKPKYYWFLLIALLGLLVLGSCSDKAVNEDPPLPNIILSVDSISVAAPYGGPSPFAQFVKVTSDQGEGVKYNFSELSRWMVLSNATGLPEGVTTDSFLISFRVTFPYMLELGHYVDTVFITGDSLANSPQHIIVNLDIGSNLSVAPKYFNYTVALNGDNPDVNYFTVGSNTSDNISYTIEENAGWINLSSYSGETDNNGDSIAVNVDISSVTEGLHVEHINIYSDDVFNSPQVVICSLMVSPWSIQPSPFISAILLDADFRDMNNGWVVGFVGDVQTRSGVIYKTEDNGLNWDINLYADTLFNYDSTLLGVIQFVSDTGWVIGEGGIVLNTFNDGLDWKIVDIGQSTNPPDLKGLHFITGDSGFIVGDTGIIMRTTDAGVSWDIVNSGVKDNLNSIFFIDHMTGWICSGQGILKTIDGGATWTPQTIPSQPDVGLNYNFQGIHFVDANNGWTIGKLGYILYTTNGGSLWNVYQLDTKPNLSSVFFTNQNNGYVCGIDGSLYRTIDGGTTWVKQLTNTTAWLNSIYFVDNNIGWVVGEDGVILHTRSGGH